jgi:hypothetical protein
MEYLYRTGLQSSMKRSTFQLLIKVFNNTNSKKMIKDVTSEIMFVLSFKEDVLALLTSCVGSVETGGASAAACYPRRRRGLPRGGWLMLAGIFKNNILDSNLIVL